MAAETTASCSRLRRGVLSPRSSSPAWYYGLNWMRHGQFFVGGWDASRGLLWWQDPGIPHAVANALVRPRLWQPMYSGFYSIWDGFYRHLMARRQSGRARLGDRDPLEHVLLLSRALAGPCAVGADCGWLSERRVVPGCPVAAVAVAFGGKLLLFVAAFVLARGSSPAIQPGEGFVHARTDARVCRLVRGGFGFAAVEPVVRSAVNAFVVCWSVMVYATYFAL